MLRVQSIPPAYVPLGLAWSLTLTVSNGKPVKMLAAPATPPLSALMVLSELPEPICLLAATVVLITVVPRHPACASNDLRSLAMVVDNQMRRATKANVQRYAAESGLIGVLMLMATSLTWTATLLQTLRLCRSVAVTVSRTDARLGNRLYTALVVLL